MVVSVFRGVEEAAACLRSEVLGEGPKGVVGQYRQREAALVRAQRAVEERGALVRRQRRQLEEAVEEARGRMHAAVEAWYGRVSAMLHDTADGKERALEHQVGGGGGAVVMTMMLRPGC